MSQWFQPRTLKNFGDSCYERTIRQNRGGFSRKRTALLDFFVPTKVIVSYAFSRFCSTVISCSEAQGAFFIALAEHRHAQLP